MNHVLQIRVRPLAGSVHKLYQLLLDDVVVREQISFIGYEEIASVCAAHRLARSMCVILPLPGEAPKTPFASANIIALP